MLIGVTSVIVAPIDSLTGPTAAASGTPPPPSSTAPTSSQIQFDSTAAFAAAAAGAAAAPLPPRAWRQRPMSPWTRPHCRRQDRPQRIDAQRVRIGRRGRTLHAQCDFAASLCGNIGICQGHAAGTAAQSSRRARTGGRGRGRREQAEIGRQRLGDRGLRQHKGVGIHECDRQDAVAFGATVAGANAARWWAPPV